MHAAVLLSALTGLCLLSASYPALACTVKSGPATTALVELFTSEGCSSCPPADRQLSSLRGQLTPDAVVVPLALHVTYWDRLGWKDRFAQTLFDTRQRQLLERHQRKVAYTPQFFVNGSELRDWSAGLSDTIRRVNATAAPLTITLKTSTLKTSTAAAGTVLIEADARAPDPGTVGALYVALSETALSSQVLRGENQGATLKHDHTARLWLGPFTLTQGVGAMREQVMLPASWRRDQLQAVAFVQGPDARILQAVSTAQCATPGGL